MCQGQICFIVPPYLLQGIADSHHEHVSAEARECALHSLQLGLANVRAQRAEIMSALGAPRGFHAGHDHSSILSSRHSIVPDHLLQHLAESQDVDEDTRKAAKQDLEHIRSKIAEFQATQAGEGSSAAATEEESGVQGLLGVLKKKKPTTDPTKVYRAVYDSQSNFSEAALPGKVIRVEGQDPVKDTTVNDAFDNCGLVLKFYKEKFDWNSIDNKGMQVKSSVHFGKNYENAFWHPTKMQMVYGDGKDFLYKFAECIDVIGHELTHAVTEHTSPLDYQGQSGALNEHISDVFGIMVKQYKEQETADVADWLIGEGCLLPGVKGVALRNMKAPGTAYDDPRFGKDPQPDNMSGFKVIKEDNGGVHWFSGIPNRAFVLTSIALGGFSWERAGQIWWATMNSGRIPVRCNFLQFADVTVEVAEEKYGADVAKVVRDAWNTVGVVRK